MTAIFLIEWLLFWDRFHPYILGSSVWSMVHFNYSAHAPFALEMAAISHGYYITKLYIMVLTIQLFPNAGNMSLVQRFQNKSISLCMHSTRFHGFLVLRNGPCGTSGFVLPKSICHLGSGRSCRLGRQGSIWSGVDSLGLRLLIGKCILWKGWGLVCW